MGGIQASAQRLLPFHPFPLILALSESRGPHGVPFVNIVALVWPPGLPFSHLGPCLPFWQSFLALLVLSGDLGPFLVLLAPLVAMSAISRSSQLRCSRFSPSVAGRLCAGAVPFPHIGPQLPQHCQNHQNIPPPPPPHIQWSTAIQWSAMLHVPYGVACRPRT